MFYFKLKFFFFNYLLACFFNISRAQAPITEITTFEFAGEHIIPNDASFKNTSIGGLSSISFYEGCVYTICDSSADPLRYYEFQATFSNSNLQDLTPQNYIKLIGSANENIPAGSVDPEALRFDTENNLVVWASEGNVKRGLLPKIYLTDHTATSTRSITLPAHFNKAANFKHNGAFEALAIDKHNNGYWFTTEYPLKIDGNPPTATSNNSPVRLTFYNKSLEKCTRQIPYRLEKTGFEQKSTKGRNNNGLVSLLSLNNNQLLSLERSYASGQGNIIRLFLVTLDASTNVINYPSLKGEVFTYATKKELFNFNEIQNELPSGKIDNIEGMCYGPLLGNGKQSLLFVSDNNFNTYGGQITQFIALSYQ